MKRESARTGALKRQPGGRQISQNALLLLWLAVFSGLYLLRDVTDATFPDIILTGVCAAAFLTLDTGASLGMFIFTTALTVPDNEIRMVYILLVGLKLLYAGKLRLRGRMMLLTLCVMLLQLVDSALFSQEGLVSYAYEYVIRMLMILLPLLWYSMDISPRHYRNALLCYALGVLLGATVTLILTMQTSNLMSLLMKNAHIRLGKAATGAAGMHTGYNANQLATMLAIAMAIILACMDRRFIPRLPAVLAIGYVILMILLTKSRTGLLVAAGVAVLYCGIVAHRRGSLLKATAVFVLLVLVTAIVVTLIPDAVESVVSRFVNQEDITNGRGDLLMLYLEEWVSDFWCFFFGYGIGTYRNMVNAFQVPHNCIADVLICCGLTGLIIFLAILWGMYRKSRRGVRDKDVLLAYLPAITAVVISMAGQYTTTGWPHMRLCFLLLAAGAFTEGKSAVRGSRRSLPAITMDFHAAAARRKAKQEVRR